MSPLPGTLSGRTLALVLLAVTSATSPVASAPDGGPHPTPEIITWPRQASDELFVARETTQPFYVMAYARGEKIESATKVEISVPANWQVWRGSDAPPTPGVLPTQPQLLSCDLTPRSNTDKSGSKDYSAALSFSNVLLVARALPHAPAGSTLHLRWKRENEILAERKVSLVPLELPHAAPAPKTATNVAMWLNDPKFNAQTMAEVYRGLRRAGVDTVIITRDMFTKNQDVLRELKMKVWISQWWGFRDYLPIAPPKEAFSTMKDGSINSKRWSPTYMAEGGASFIQSVEKIADELKALDGIAGLLLDYEPGAEGLDADYSAASQTAFEKTIGEKIADWPAAVLPGGKWEEKWIDFRNEQSEAYTHWFRVILRERAPGLQLAVSTSGATGTPDDMNRRLAATDIAQLSRAADAVFPQLYSWTSALPAQLDRFNEKLELGRTTLARTQSKTIPLVGSLAGGRIPLAQPKYLRTQILDWWFHGADGFGIWQYFYGVDGRYMQMTSELATLFEAAGAQPKNNALKKKLIVPPINNLQILYRTSNDGKTFFIGLFNYSEKEVAVPLRDQFKTKLFSEFAVKELPVTVTIAPWSAQVVKLSAAN
jgi:hypothetical protein